MQQCYLLGIYEFSGGTCAQWFSGSASALAVAVALGAHFYTSWRQLRLEHRQDAAEIAGISMLLRACLNDAEANAYLFFSGCRTVRIWGNKYTVSRLLGAVRAVHRNVLDKNQADVFLRYSGAVLAEMIDETISKINLTNLGIEDYAKTRSEFSQIIEQYIDVDIENTIDKDSQDAKLLLKRIFTISTSVEYFVNTTRQTLRESIDVVEKFNEFCAKRAALAKYEIPTAKSVARLKILESDTETSDTAA